MHFFIQSEWAENLDVHVMFVVCYNKNSYQGGTEKGREFLLRNHHISPSFLTSIDSRESHSYNYMYM